MSLLSVFVSTLLYSIIGLFTFFVDQQHSSVNINQYFYLLKFAPFMIWLFEFVSYIILSIFECNVVSFAKLKPLLAVCTYTECPTNVDNFWLNFAILKTTYTAQRNIMHSKEFAGNQGKHQNWVPSILSHNLWLSFMGMKQFFLTKLCFKGLN